VLGAAEHRLGPLDCAAEQERPGERLTKGAAVRRISGV
jgi:hypothetical protein